ncbi:MAG: carbon-nitrogen hydrolase family protein [Calditrichia bacterium]
MKSFSHSYRIAAAQTSPQFLDKTRSIQKACDLIHEAAKKGAKLVVFPEVFIPGYPDWIWVVPNSQAALLNDLYVRLIENSVAIPDAATEQLCQAAKKAKIHVVMGLHERNREASNYSLYNTMLVIDDQGNIVGKHRKLIPTGGERLVWAMGDGSTLQVFDTVLGKLGGLICWENYMPLARQAMYAEGAQILLAPTWDKSENWLNSLRHIAREGGLFVVGCCSAIRMEDIPDELEFKSYYPEGKEWINTGNSCIINPRGEFIAGPLEAKEDILYADIDLREIAAAKRMFDVAGHYARPDVFQFAVNRKATMIMPSKTGSNS